jgi:hypothetical protein
LWASVSKQTTQQQTIHTLVAKKTLKRGLAFVIEIAEDFFLRLWLRDVDTVDSAVGTPVSTGLSTSPRRLGRESDPII